MIIPEPGDPVFVDKHPELTGRVLCVEVEPSGYVRVLTDNLLQVVAAEARARCDRNWDAAIAIVGAEGSGKSTCAYQLAKEFAGQGFDPIACYAYDVPEFAEKIWQIYEKKMDGTLTGRPVIWSDEGINILYGRNSMTRESKLITQVMAMMRSLGAMYLYCIPRAHDIDVMLRDARLWSLLDCSQARWSDPDGTVWPEHGPATNTFRRGTFRWWCRPPEGGDMRRGYYGIFPPLTEVEDRIYQQMKIKAQGRKLSELVGSVGLPEGSEVVPHVGRGIPADYQFKPGRALVPGSKSAKRKAAHEQRNDDLLRLREEKNLSFNQLADLTGLSKSTIRDGVREAEARRELKASAVRSDPGRLRTISLPDDADQPGQRHEGHHYACKHGEEPLISADLERREEAEQPHHHGHHRHPQVQVRRLRHGAHDVQPHGREEEQHGDYQKILHAGGFFCHFKYVRN